MKIANDHTLAELEAIFNNIANQIHQKQVVEIPALAAQVLYPDIFVKPKDHYMKTMIQEVLDDFQTQESEYVGSEEDPYENGLAYFGNMHVPAVSEIWAADEGGRGRK